MLKIVERKEKEIVPVKPKFTRKKTELKISDLYPYYVKNKIGADIGKELYYSVLRAYNAEVVKRIIDGKRVKLFPGLGELMVIEIQRTKDYIIHCKTGDVLPNTRGIDWGLTKKLNLRNEEGKLIRQFFTSSKQPTYYKCRWMKTYANAINVGLYKFTFQRDSKRLIPLKLKSDDLVSSLYNDNNLYCSRKLSKTAEQMLKLKKFNDVIQKRKS